MHQRPTLEMADGAPFKRRPSRLETSKRSTPCRSARRAPADAEQEAAFMLVDPASSPAAVMLTMSGCVIKCDDEADARSVAVARECVFRPLPVPLDGPSNITSSMNRAIVAATRRGTHPRRDPRNNADRSDGKARAGHAVKG